MADPLDFLEPGYSSIRKRALSKTLARVEASAKLSALQLAEKRGLYSVERDLIAQDIDLKRAAYKRLRDQMTLIEQQDAAATKELKEIKRLTPLQQSRRREGLFRRSEQDRIAAIAGLLQRERRQNAPLTREAEARAKAIAAASRRSDPYASMVSHAQQAAYVVRPGEIAGADQFDDPCIELRRVQRNRRETLFALGHAGRGYRTKHVRKVC